jgi:hypothetical protein
LTDTCLVLAVNTSDISIDNKIRICQAASTSYVRIVNNIQTFQAANTSDISIENLEDVCFFSMLKADVLTA